MSKTSVAGSWGAVAGALRFFADRFGIPRASIEGTTLSYDLVREHAALGPPRVVLVGPRKHQGLAVERRLGYAGFDLGPEVEPIRGAIPAQLQSAASEVLADALLAGETAHPDQGRVRRAAETLNELWRRSGGMLAAASPDAVRALMRAQLDGVGSWQEFLRTRFTLDPTALVDDATRATLEVLPSTIRVRGDAAPLDYEVEDGQGIARVRLREGQAKRLREGDLPPLDRPLRFALVRGRHPPVRAETLPELHAVARRPPRNLEEDEGDRPRGQGKGREPSGRGPRGGPRGRRRYRPGRR